MSTKRAMGKSSGKPTKKNYETDPKSVQIDHPPIKLEIEDLTDEGSGVGRYNNQVIFVPKAIPGDRVTVQLKEIKKNYATGRIVSIDQSSSHRIKPPCPYTGECGGCAIQEMDYDGQLAFKEKQVKDALERIGGFSVVPMNPIVGMAFPYHYRNKALYPFGVANTVTGKSQVVLGFYQPGSHRVVPILACMIQQGDGASLLGAVKDWANANGVSVYNAQSHTGLLRHLFVRTNQAGEVMVGLVINGFLVPNSDELIAKLRSAVPSVRSIQLNIQTKRGTTILGDTCKTLFGDDTLSDNIGDLHFDLAMPAFFQVNPEQTRVLYQKAVDACALTGHETVWDIYCGAGTITLNLAKGAKVVYGNEIHPKAIENARSNALLNNILNAHFIVGPAEEVIPKWLVEHPRAEVVVLDPPRKGAEPAVLDAIIKMAPERIVYVSCKPSTLARDVKILCESGYQLMEVTPVDMFPHSGHVETVVLLSHKKSQASSPSL